MSRGGILARTPVPYVAVSGPRRHSQPTPTHLDIAVLRWTWQATPCEARDGAGQSGHALQAGVRGSSPLSSTCGNVRSRSWPRPRRAVIVLEGHGSYGLSASGRPSGL